MKTRLVGALAGLLAALVALGAAELVAALLGRPSSPVVSVGGAFVDRTPRWLKEFAIQHFGQNDKNVLLAGVVSTVLVLALVVGALAVHRVRVAVGLVVALGIGAALVALTRPTADAVDVLPSLAAGAAGALALWTMLRTGSPAREAGSRRAFLMAAGGTAVLAAGTGGLGRLLAGRHSAAASREAVVLPKPLSPAPAVPAGYTLPVPGITPFYTNPQGFYRVDTALVVPQLSTDAWRLRVHGDVERPFTLEWRDLLAMPMIERDITLTCVSNEVGGRLAGNARWQGVPVKTLLERARPRSGADQVVTRSVDGMTIGTPTSALLDGRDAMVAVSMNGQPLRPEHGFPVRMVVPGLYGYVSATKWLVDMELTTFDAYDPYWVKRGWDKQASIKTASRIDTPKPLSTSKSGVVVVGGVAWAQERGVSKVEVRADEGPWQVARLSAAVGKDTWRQWSWQWNVTKQGNHKLEVRATDGTGAVQPQRRAAPFPGGSQGWHSVLVNIGS